MIQLEAPLSFYGNGLKQSIINDQFERAKNLDEEASIMEDEAQKRIKNLEDECEQFKETIKREKQRFYCTKSIVEMKQTTIFNATRNDFFSPIKINNDEDNREIRRLKRNIKDLKVQISQVKNETIKYQEILQNLSKNNKTPQINKKTVNTEDYYQMLIKELREKLSELQDRHILAIRELAKPIDDLYTNEQMTINAENSLNRISHRFNQSPPSKPLFNIKHLQDEVDIMIATNFERKKNIESMKETVKDLKSSLKSLSFRKVAQTPKPIKRFKDNNFEHKISVHAKTLSRDALNTKVDQMFSKLIERGNSLDEIEEEVRNFEERVTFIKEKMAKDWEQKMDKIKSLSFQFRCVQSLNTQIHAQQERNNKILPELHEMEEDKQLILEKIEKRSHEKTYLDSLRTEIIKIRSIQQQKQVDIDSRAIVIQKHKNEILKLQKQIKKKENDLKKKRADVEELENRAEEMKKKVNEMTSQTRMAMSKKLIKSKK